METIIFSAENLTAQIKMSDYLRKIGFSASLITKVKFGGVSLNGETVTMRALVKNQDEIKVTFSDEESENIEPIEIPLDIVYEDAHILVVNKPKDMPTHPSRGNHLPTLANAVCAYLGQPFVFRSINRLDRGTGGIVLIAKNPYSAAKLGRAMKERKFRKRYLAIISGMPNIKSGRIDAPIARKEEGNILRVVRDDGKTAITDYKVIGATDNGDAICEVELHTGRTHQIRVHMAHIGHPLVGDFLYGNDSDDGYSLTCSELTFPHPLTDELLTFRVNDQFDL